MLRQQWPHVHKSGLSAMCEFDEARILRLQRMTAKRAATAGSIEMRWSTAVIFEQLPGAKKHLVVGNHDRAPTLALPWDSVYHLAEVRDGPHRQAHTLCHYPLITWNHARRQALHMFGHVHNTWLGSRNAVNVGVDVWDFMPVSFEQVAERASELPLNKHLVYVEPGVSER
jgi:calcineurin-like phosphoesterase family protein